MKGEAKVIVKILSSFLCVIIFISCCSMAVWADQQPSKTVRVAYYQSSRFQDGASPSEEKSGYSYEYLQKVSYYSGWKYEYVYGSWSELYEQFLRGEIDIMAGISDTADRKGKILFPKYEMGSESYYIYKHEADATISGTDPLSLSGKRIGVIKNTLIPGRLSEWTSDCHVSLEAVEYDSFDTCTAAFYRNEIDMITATDYNVSLDSAMEPVAKIGEEAFYLAVTKSKPELLEELNNALVMMNEVEPYILETLQYTYFGNTLVSKQLSVREEHWLTQHPVLRVGYFEDYMPYCGTDSNGSPSGIMTDVLDAILKEVAPDSNIQVEYRAYGTDEAMIADLTSGNLDLIFPVSGSLTSAESYGYFVTAPVVTAGMYLVYSGAYNHNTTGKIAVSTANGKQYRYTLEAYPDSQIIECGSIEDCLAAVDSGKANSTILNGARLSSILRKSGFEDMTYSLLSKSEDRCFAVEAGNDGLLILINRGLKLIGSDYGVNASNKYINADITYTFRDFIRNNAVYVIILIFVIASTIVLLFARDSRRMKQQEKEREKYQKELEEKQIRLEEKALEQDRTNAMLDEARRQAEAASSAKTAFLFNMSHDIRTPMNAIIGFTSLLEMHQDKPEKRTDYLRKIQDSSTVLLSIINNVLEMARIEKGALVSDESTWSAEQFVDVLHSVFQEMMAQKGITFTTRIDVQHHYVLCDSIKLREVFINILSNAYKYTNPGGKVDLLLTELPSDRDGFVLYRTTVSDTGIGMSEEFLPHLFEEFSRENTSTDNKIEGTGLGMSIVKRLVDFMGGTITVSSEKGVGTTFTVTIPHGISDKSGLAAHPEVHADPTLFRGKRILLAEDNDLNAEIAMEILKETGFQIDRAENGQAAVDMLNRADAGYYDLILMDIQMPEMNGYAATRAIRGLSDPGKANIPIFAMTANAFEEDKREAMRAGMNAHLAKPINVGELMKALSGVLQ